MEWLETNSSKYVNIQSMDAIITDLGYLINSLAFINGQMAVAERNFNEVKAKAYEVHIFSRQANNLPVIPSVAKDYIAAKCAQFQYEYSICERCSRTISRTIEALRSILSALKTEFQTSNFNS
jgi:hypothetical protein